jgi:hypothetical protein
MSWISIRTGERSDKAQDFYYRSLGWRLDAGWRVAAR